MEITEDGVASAIAFWWDLKLTVSSRVIVVVVVNTGMLLDDGGRGGVVSRSWGAAVAG